MGHKLGGKVPTSGTKGGKLSPNQWDITSSELSPNQTPFSEEVKSQPDPSNVPLGPPKPLENRQKKEKRGALRASSPPKSETKKPGKRLDIETLAEDWRTYCETKRPELNPNATFEDFSDYWRAIPGKQGVKKLDWLATWRRWVRNQHAPSKPSATQRNHASTLPHLARSPERCRDRQQGARR